MKRLFTALKFIIFCQKTSPVKNFFRDKDKITFKSGAKENNPMGGDGVRDGLEVAPNASQCSYPIPDIFSHKSRYERIILPLNIGIALMVVAILAAAYNLAKTLLSQ